jgi:hypothetical protein
MELARIASAGLTEELNGILDEWLNKPEDRNRVLAEVDIVGLRNPELLKVIGDIQTSLGHKRPGLYSRLLELSKKLPSMPATSKPRSKVETPKQKTEGDAAMATKTEKSAPAATTGDKAPRRVGASTFDSVVMKVVGQGSKTIDEINEMVKDAADYSEAEVTKALAWISDSRIGKATYHFARTDDNVTITLTDSPDWHNKLVEKLRGRKYFKAA